MTTRTVIAWKFHYARVPHVGGCHETENGARGANCSGPTDEDYLDADAVIDLAGPSK